METQTGQLAAAVAAVMNEVQRLDKNAKNTHGNYKYVSIDDMKDGLRPLLAKNGLVPRITETQWRLELLRSKSGETVNAIVSFDIFLEHTSGERSEADHTTVCLPQTGAQTTGAAKSYALKEWLKGRFLVSTGEIDADADSHAPQDYTREASEPKSKADSRETYTMLQTELRKNRTPAELSDWNKMRAAELASLPEDWYAVLKEEYAALKKALAEAAMGVPASAPKATAAILNDEIGF